MVYLNQAKYKAAIFPGVFVPCVFSDLKGGRRMLGAGLLVCSGIILPSCGNSLIRPKL